LLVARVVRRAANLPDPTEERTSARRHGHRRLDRQAQPVPLGPHAVVCGDDVMRERGGMTMHGDARTECKTLNAAVLQIQMFVRAEERRGVD